jgi:amino acid permease
VPALTVQFLWLLLLAIPIASIAWTVTHEDVFREPRDYCKQKSESSRRLWQRKFFYLFTCEYCFSHYITALFLMVTRFKLLYPDWRGYVISLFALVWIANVYMGIFAHLRLDISQERIEIKSKDLDLQSKKEEMQSERAA